MLSASGRCTGRPLATRTLASPTLATPRARRHTPLSVTASLAVGTSQLQVSAAAAVQRVQQLLVPVAEPRVSTSGTVVELDAENFYSFLRDAGQQPVVVDFYTSWCGPCKVIAPKVEIMAQEYDSRGVLFAKVNCAGANKALAINLGVKALPTFYIFKQQHKVGEMVGAKIEVLRRTVDLCLAVQDHRR